MKNTAFLTAYIISKIRLSVNKTSKSNNLEKTYSLKLCKMPILASGKVTALSKKMVGV